MFQVLKTNNKTKPTNTSPCFLGMREEEEEYILPGKKIADTYLAKKSFFPPVSHEVRIKTALTANSSSALAFLLFSSVLFY